MVDPPTTPPREARGHAPSLVIVNTGDGKGKTTAALGTMLRALARGWRVCVIQFMKSDRWKTGEEKVARSLGVEWWTLGEGFTWEADDLKRMQMTAVAAWDEARQRIAAGAYDLVVLDELTYPLAYGWIDVRDAVAAIARRPQHVNVIVTGRDAPSELIDVADTVTDMRNVKHAFDGGVAARRGIDF